MIARPRTSDGTDVRVSASKSGERDSVGEDARCYRRNHQTTMKNQKTRMRNMIYHSHRQPCRSAMVFILRKVPASMPPVSANASFY